MTDILKGTGMAADNLLRECRVFGMQWTQFEGEDLPLSRWFTNGKPIVVFGSQSHYG
mgnify:CR=1 FL=1